MSSTFLLSIDTKQSTDIKAPPPPALLQHARARSHYDNRAAVEIENDLTTIYHIRSLAVQKKDGKVKLDKLTTTKKSLLEYYGALAAMEKMFPIKDGVDDQICIAFTWFDAFKSTIKSNMSSLVFEKAAIMFNIGAIQSQIALSHNRGTAQGRIDSKKVFEEAAGIFAHLKDIDLQIDLEIRSAGIFARLRDLISPERRPVDLSPECCSMLELLFLAQAQECAWEQAATSKKSPKILCRLAAAAGDYYKEIADALDTPPLKDHFDKSWMAHATVKSLIYQVEAAMQSASDLRASDPETGVAKGIARLRAVEKMIEKAKKEAKHIKDELRNNVMTKEKALTEQLTTAVKDNNAVYFKKVPTVADLPSIEPFIAVKPVSPDEMLKSPRKWFQIGVPNFPDHSAPTVASCVSAQADQLQPAAENSNAVSCFSSVRPILRNESAAFRTYLFDAFKILAGSSQWKTLLFIFSSMLIFWHIRIAHETPPLCTGPIMTTQAALIISDNLMTTSIPPSHETLDDLKLMPSHVDAQGNMAYLAFEEEEHDVVGEAAEKMPIAGAHLFFEHLKSWILVPSSNPTNQTTTDMSDTTKKVPKVSGDIFTPSDSEDLNPTKLETQGHETLKHHKHRKEDDWMYRYRDSYGMIYMYKA